MAQKDGPEEVPEGEVVWIETFGLWHPECSLQKDSGSRWAYTLGFLRLFVLAK